MTEVADSQGVVQRLRSIEGGKRHQDADMANALNGGGSPPNTPTMNDRLDKLEISVESLKTAMDGLRHSQNLTIGTVAALGGVIVALMIYTFTRVDQLSDRIAAVPGQIAAENRDIVKTLSDAITATKQQAPQVILMPAPVLPAPTPAPTRGIVPYAPQPGTLRNAEGYCKALAARARTAESSNQTVDPEVAAAVARCEQQNFSAGILTLENILLKKGIPLPDKAEF